MNFFFNESARIEHLEHVAYYEGCQRGLGTRYLEAFDVAMAKVCEAPHRHRVEFPLTFGVTQFRAFRTTSSFGRQEKTLKFWLSHRIVVGQVTG